MTRIGDIRHNERESTLSIPHSALAEHYLKTAEVYHTLTETNAVRMQQRYDFPPDLPDENLTTRAYLKFLPDETERERIVETFKKAGRRK